MAIAPHQARTLVDVALRRARDLVPGAARAPLRRLLRGLLGRDEPPVLALALLLPEADASEVRRLQGAMRAAGASPDLATPPHVTLKLGFQAPAGAGLERWMEELAAGAAPVAVDLGEVARFDDGVAYVAVAPDAALDALRRRVVAELSSRFGVAPEPLEVGDAFRFHVTLSHGVSAEALARSAAGLAAAPRRCRLERLAWLRWAGDRWVVHRAATLGGRAVGAEEGETLERLRWRRQFLLAPGPIPARPGWTRLELRGGRCLTAHPDLGVAHVAAGGRSVTLLGYALDPERPRDGDEAIAARLLGPSGGWEEVRDRTASLGGRWALLVDDGAAQVLLHDPGGQRQVHHARGRDGLVWCASGPGLLAESLRLEPDPAALAFMDSRVEVDGFVYWMPGDRTVYREVRALLPNHALLLDPGRVERFPSGAGRPAVPGRPAREVLPECVRLLRGLVAAARLRAPLAIPMTAGWDSRLMLALAGEGAREDWLYTLVYPEEPADGADVAVPARLLSRLGLAHHLISPPAEVDQGLKAVVRANVSAVKAAYGTDVQALRERYPAGRLCLSGDVAEVVKCHFRMPDGAGSPGAAELAAFMLLGEHPFVLEAFDEWLAGAPRDDAPLLDLFCWEQMAGRWQALIRAEYDVVQDCLSPLACRRLLALMLSVDEAERRGPAYPMLRALIAALRPEALAEPINPPRRRGLAALAGRVVEQLRRHG
jgi:hypothetical protein